MRKFVTKMIGIMGSFFLMLSIFPLTVLAEDLPVPEHSKYVSSNPDGTYTLTLDVTGKVLSESDKNPINVLLIVDTSGSMSETVSNDSDSSRISRIQELVGNLATKVLSPDSENQMAMVQFNGSKTGTINDGLGYWDSPYDDATEVLDWTNSASSVQSAVNGLETGGGTNWEAGLIKGKEEIDLLGTDSTRANTYVVFLSDGNPTYHYDDGGITQGSGKLTLQMDVDHAKAAAKDLCGTTFYSVRIGGRKQYMREIAAAAGGTYKDGSTTEALDQVFDELESLTQKTYKNIVITDTLSKYADIVDPQNYTVTAKNADGSSISVPWKCEFDYDSNTKTVTCSFPKDTALEDGVTYSIHFMIRPSQIAINEYAENGRVYPHKGDAGTGNNSANLAGFYTNDAAVVRYNTMSEGMISQYEQIYAKPVLQVSIDPIKKLPKAGGPGTWWLYAIGIGIMGFAGTLLIIQKKKLKNWK